MPGGGRAVFPPIVLKLQGQVGRPLLVIRLIALQSSYYTSHIVSGRNTLARPHLERRAPSKHPDQVHPDAAAGMARGVCGWLSIDCRWCVGSTACPETESHVSTSPPPHTYRHTHAHMHTAPQQQQHVRDEQRRRKRRELPANLHSGAHRRWKVGGDVRRARFISVERMQPAGCGGRKAGEHVEILLPHGHRQRCSSKQQRLTSGCRIISTPNCL